MADVDQGQLKGAFDSLLTYIDKPWKVFAIAFLGILAFGGFFIYTNQGFLLSAYEKKKSLPVMDSSKFEDTAKMLMKKTGGNIVVIFEVDMILNQRKVVRMFDKDGRIKQFDGVTTQLLTNNESSNKDAVALMAGEVPCHTYTKPRSIISMFYMDMGITNACRVSVPSTPNAFIGQITVGFNEKPTTDIEHYLRIAGDDLLKAQ